VPSMPWPFIASQVPAGTRGCVQACRLPYIPRKPWRPCTGACQPRVQLKKERGWMPRDSIGPSSSHLDWCRSVLSPKDNKRSSCMRWSCFCSFPSGVTAAPRAASIPHCRCSSSNRNVCRCPGSFTHHLFDFSACPSPIIGSVSSDVIIRRQAPTAIVVLPLEPSGLQRRPPPSPKPAWLPWPRQPSVLGSLRSPKRLRHSSAGRDSFAASFGPT
jgi:hypothetical protein